MLHVDIPTERELSRLVAARGPAMVSIYLPASPETQRADEARILLGNLVKDAIAQLEDGGVEKLPVAALADHVADLVDDDDFWRLQARSLALFVTPEAIQAFRLPTNVTPMVQVADRFHLKPLLRAVMPGQHGFVLALEESGARLVEVFSDLPAVEVKVPDMPKSAAGAAGTSSLSSRSYSGRIGGSEGRNVLLRAWRRKVDAALRPFLSGRQEPLILVAAEPLLSMFRSVSSHHALAAEDVRISPARLSPAELAERARPVLDGLIAADLAAARRLFEARAGEGRATADLSDAARAATFGAVETLLVDIDVVVPGRIDEDTGALTPAEAEGPGSYGVVDEIAGRVLASGGRVLAARAEDMPTPAPLAAILRYAV